MEFLLLSLIAGALTVLAPCILPFLPVIIGGSLTSRNALRPLIITLSLSFSIVVFTMLLKVSTAFIDVPREFWSYFSSSIIFLYALTLIFPMLWVKILSYLPTSFDSKAHTLISQNQKNDSVFSAIVIGFALGPIFASCSPTYFLILGTVLPASFFWGFINLIVYSLGLSIMMFLIAYFGQQIMQKLQIAAKPDSIFKKILGVLLIFVSLAIATGADKDFEAYLLDQGFFDVGVIEQSLIEKIQE